MKVFLENKTLNFDNLIYYLNKINHIIEKIRSCLEENSEINVNYRNISNEVSKIIF